MALTSKQRKYLRALAHSLDPYIIIGKNGLSSSSINSINKSLLDHELIKLRIKVGIIKDIAPLIEKKTQSFVVGTIGKIIILYKKSDEIKDSNIKLPK